MTNELAQRIVTTARGWIGTRFHHQGRMKATATHSGGCDCLGLLVGIADELNIISNNNILLCNYDVKDYGHIPDGKRMQAAFGSLFDVVPTEATQPGDILLMRFDGEPQHVAIVSDYPYGGLGIIHALAAARKVVEHRLDSVWKSRIVQAYRLNKCSEFHAEN